MGEDKNANKKSSQLLFYMGLFVFYLVLAPVFVLGLKRTSNRPLMLLFGLLGTPAVLLGEWIPMYAGYFEYFGLW